MLVDFVLIWSACSLVAGAVMMLDAWRGGRLG